VALDSIEDIIEDIRQGKPVIGGNAGGIPGQIEEGETGFLVNSPEQAAERIVELIANPERAREMGAAGREKVRRNFLITRLLEQHLDLLGSFEARFVPSLRQ